MASSSSSPKSLTTNDAIACNVEAERAVLAALIIHPPRLADCGPLAQHPEWFYHEPYRLMADAILTLITREWPVEIETISNVLRERGNLGKSITLADIAEVTSTDCSTTSAGVRAYAEMVMRASQIRERYRYGERMLAAIAADDFALLDDLRQERTDALAAYDGEGVKRTRFKLLSVQELRNQPLPEALIDRVLIASTTSMVYGPSQAGKSIAIADATCRVSLGWPWMGHDTKQGVVVYVAAEGGTGMRLRIEAWMQENNVEDLPNLFVIPQAVQLLEGEQVHALIEDLATLPDAPVWIIVDTVSQTSSGGDENSNADMARYTNALQALRDATGAHVTMIHHCEKATGGFRGASSLFNNVDTVIKITRDEDVSSIACEKQRDGWAKFKMQGFTIKQVAFDDYGDITSAVIVPMGIVTKMTQARLTDAELRALKILHDSSTGRTFVEWRKATQLPNSTFLRVKDKLEMVGFITKTPTNGYHSNTNGARYLNEYAGGSTGSKSGPLGPMDAPGSTGSTWVHPFRGGGPNGPDSADPVGSSDGSGPKGPVGPTPIVFPGVGGNLPANGA